MLDTFTDIFFLDEKAHTDARGTFLKLFDSEILGGAAFSVEQANLVATPLKGVFRGLHYQAGDRAESKIFRVIEGRIQLVVFDVRPDSATRGESGSVELSGPREAVRVPRGYATGYLTLEPDTRVLYLTDAPYCPEAERGISILDPRIQLPLAVADPELSAKDASWPHWN